MKTHKTVQSWTTDGDIMKSRDLYENTELLLHIFQSLALLEVVHAAVGLVRSNPVLTFLQVLSRLLVVWVINYNFKDVMLFFISNSKLYFN
jgi:hypothetical protein